MKIVKKITLFIIALCALHACTQEKKNTGATVLFENFEEFEFVTFDPLTFQPTSLIEDSLRKIHHFDIQQPAMGYLKINENQFPVYLDSGYDLKITKCANEIIFEGLGADINNHLVKFQQMQKEYAVRTHFNDLDYDDFVLRLDSLTGDFDELQKEIAVQKDKKLLGDFFTAYIMPQKLNYALVHYNLSDKNSPIPDEIQSAFDGLPEYSYLLDLGNADYLVALLLYQDAVIGPQIWKEEFNESDSIKNLYHVILFNGISELPIEQNLKEFFYANTILRELRSRGISNNYLQLAERYKSEYPNSNYIRAIEDYHGELDVLFNAPFPDIKLADQHGNDIMLKDFQGKVIYLDIWATWCKPCVEEFPNSIALRQKLPDEDILFAYLSVDSDTAKWKSYLDENDNMKGMHLIEQESGTVWKGLKLSGIPRYMLIDLNGNITNAHAPKPSSEKIMAAINELI